MRLCVLPEATVSNHRKVNNVNFASEQLLQRHGQAHKLLKGRQKAAFWALLRDKVVVAEELVPFIRQSASEHTDSNDAKVATQHRDWVLVFFQLFKWRHHPITLCLTKRRGTPDMNRTCDPLLRRQLLYPLSYGGVLLLF